MQNTLFQPGVLDILPIFLAFCAGMFGAAFGGIHAFIMCGFVGLAACGMMAAAPADTAMLNIAFGFFLHPAFAFLGDVLALAYAKKKGYIASGKALDLPLISIRKPGPILMGGLAAAIGYILIILLTGANYANIAADGGALVIVPVSLIIKAIFEGSIVGKVPADHKRFSAHKTVAWVPHVHIGWEKLIIGVAFGGCAAAASVLLATSGGAAFATDVTAAAPNYAPAFFCFFFSAVTLMWSVVGFPIPVNHHTTIISGYAVCAAMWAGVTDPVTLVLWGIGMGTFATFLADFFADCFYVYGDTHVDPPACAIVVSSFIIMTIFVRMAPSILTSWVVPAVILVAAVAISIAQGIYKDPKEA